MNDDGYYNPTSAGIMRALTTNDFELTTIEFIQFWILNPFNDDAENVDTNSMHNGDCIYLGNISEDILPFKKELRNGLPSTESVTDNLIQLLARISTEQVVVNAFDTDPDSRLNQDIGLDGWNNADEQIWFADYVSWVQNNPNLLPDVKARMVADPSGDDYNYYLDDNYDSDQLDILTRYKKYNGMEGNSPTTEMSDTANADGYPTQGTNAPDIEE